MNVIEWIATLLLWVGHNVPAIGQYVGYGADAVWIDAGAFVLWLTF